MALHSQVWPPATPMPMAESSLYRQRLEVIAEKRRLQEEIRAARRELEEEKLRVERLKRKSLRERWLMDGSAEGSEPLEDPASKDPQSPEGQAQARIRNLEDSLFTLQSQLQLLQSASTGAQHRPAGRPTWRRQGPRPLSQPTLEAGSEGHTDVDKRASLPAGPVAIFPESPSESKEEPAGVLPALRPLPGDIGASSEANGPCPGHSPLTGQELSPGAASAAEDGVIMAKGDDVVEVVWEGLRPTEDCATAPTGPELEAKVEEVVLEALVARQGAGRSELPSWVKEDRGVAEVVWEGLGGSDSAETMQTSSQRLQEQLKAEASRKGEGVPRDSPEGDGQGGPGGEEGSFIWVERVNLSEDWEELLMEGLEGPMVAGTEGRVGGPPGAGPGGEQSWEVERREAETSEELGEKGREKPGAGREEVLRDESRRGSQASLEPEWTGEEGSEEKDEGEGVSPDRETDQEKWEVEVKEDEKQWEAERGGEETPETAEHKEPLGGERKGSETAGEGSLEAERKGSEKLLDGETAGSEELLDRETVGSEKLLDWETAAEGSLGGITKQSEELLDGEAEGEESLDGEAKGDESPSEVEMTPEAQGEVSPEEQRALGEGAASQVEEVNKAGTPLEVKPEPLQQEDQGPLDPEKQEGTAVEGAGRPPGDATPLLSQTPAPEQPAESQPLLRQEGASSTPSAHSAPTYAPARQPEPASRTEGEDTGGPKQKTCQCCAVM